MYTYEATKNTFLSQRQSLPRSHREFLDALKFAPTLIDELSTYPSSIHCPGYNGVVEIANQCSEGQEPSISLSKLLFISAMHSGTENSEVLPKWKKKKLRLDYWSEHTWACWDSALERAHILALGLPMLEQASLSPRLRHMSSSQCHVSTTCHGPLNVLVSP